MIWQTLLGGALAIAGGFGAAWYQSHYAVAIATRIRRQERREEGLLALNASVAEAHSKISYLHQMAQEIPLSGQYLAARQALEGLLTQWHASFSGMIPDQSISDLVATLSTALDRLLPGGAEALTQYGEDADPETRARGFVADLGALLELLGKVQAAVQGKVAGLLTGK